MAPYSFCDKGAKLPLESAPGLATVWGMCVLHARRINLLPPRIRYARGRVV